jgi:cell division protein FtsL
MRRRRYKQRRPAMQKSFWRNRYIHIAAVSLIIVGVASFYVYQRVWVRNLVAEIENLEKQNEEAKQHLSTIKSEWVAASSIARIESAVGTLRLGLEPTKPVQNFTLRPKSDWEQSRYAGLMKALDKLQKNIPLVTSNEADAGELFDTE